MATHLPQIHRGGVSMSARYLKHGVCVSFGIVLASVSAFQAMSAEEGVKLDLRWRHEQVSANGFAEDAMAATLRTRLGYSLNLRESWTGLVEFEDVRIAGADDYNSTANGATTYPVIADPADTELNRLQVRWQGEAAVATAGRQRINLRNQRFIGAVGFRQNEQTFDALRGEFTPGDWNVETIYLARANRIFGAHHPDPARANTAMDGFAVDAERGFGNLNTGIFAYGFDFEDQPAQSHRNLGLRVGWKPGAWSVYGEFAQQDGWRDGALDDALDYHYIAAGRQHADFSWQLGEELLGGNGSAGFQTPFATLHKFNGWTDVFLVTPASGLRDRWLALDGALGGQFSGMKLGFRWHEFSADTDGSDLGDELGFVVSRSFGNSASLSLKLASFSGASGYGDVSKAWLTFETSL